MENPLYMQTGTINFINWTFNFSVTLDGIYDIISQRQHSDTLTASKMAKQTNKVFNDWWVYYDLKGIKTKIVKWYSEHI